jgi:predicted MPP superfamily phosphohydrolase
MHFTSLVAWIKTTNRWVTFGNLKPVMKDSLLHAIGFCIFSLTFFWLSSLPLSATQKWIEMKLAQLPPPGACKLIGPLTIQKANVLVYLNDYLATVWLYDIGSNCF